MLLNFKSKPNYIGYDLEGIPKSKLESLRKRSSYNCMDCKNKEDMEKAYKYSDNITFENFYQNKLYYRLTKLLRINIMK